MFKNPDPSCEKDCRFQQGPASTTLVYYPPIYDKHGNNLNPDRNTISYEMRCSFCDRKWKIDQDGNKFTVIQMNRGL
jgi:hypothetical protein